MFQQSRFLRPTISAKICDAVLDSRINDLNNYLNELINHGDSISINECSYCGESPLHLAVYMRNGAAVAAIKSLRDCDVLATDISGDNAIHIAAKLGDVTILKQLLESSPPGSIDRVNSTGYSALAIVQSSISDHDIEFLTRFSTFDSFSLQTLRSKIVEGRKCCEDYIVRFINEEKQNFRQEEMNKAILTLTKREKDRRILNPMTTVKIPRIYSDICESTGVTFEHIEDKVQFEVIAKSMVTIDFNENS